MSDSENDTVIVMPSVLTISANDELELFDEDDELDAPRLPAVEVPLLPLPLDDELEELEPGAFDDEPAVTASPGRRLESEAIVPLTGAYSFVLASAPCAFFRLTCAWSTDACAEAMLAGEGVVVVVELVLPDEVAGRAGVVVVGGVLGFGVVVVAGEGFFFFAK